MLIILKMQWAVLNFENDGTIFQKFQNSETIFQNFQNFQNDETIFQNFQNFQNEGTDQNFQKEALQNEGPSLSYESG